MFDYSAARRFLACKQAQFVQDNLQRWELASQDARKIIAMIQTEFSPLAIYQWGSVIHKENFREYSDIDIAVEGLAQVDAIFKIARKADTLTTFPVHIVELEKIEPQYAELIRRKGKKIYESH